MDIANILIAEDEFIVASDIKLRLKSFGYNVLGIVSKGEDVISSAEEMKPDLIMMDVMLQGKIDGIEAAKTLRTKFKIPIIFLTASTDESTLNRAKEAEPYGYILKPFEARELHTTIEIALYRHQMEMKLVESEERFKALVENSSDAIALLDETGKITYATNSTKNILGYTPEEFIGMNVRDLVVKEDLEDIYKNIGNITKEPNKTVTVQVRAIHKSGKIIWAESTSTNLLNISPINAIVSNFKDITERKLYEEEIRKSHERADSLVNSSIIGITITDLDGKIIEANDKFLEMIGYTREDLENNQLNWRELTPKTFKKIDDNANRELKKYGYCQPFEKEYIRKDGIHIPILLGATKMKDTEDQYVCFIMDMTERKKIEKQMQYLSFYDQMTGLPNKELFLDRLNIALANAKRAGSKVAILFIDLDNFKKINDTYGHEAGDTLIKELAQRFISSMRETDTVSRRSGDEFMIILPDVSSNEDIKKVIKKLFKDLQLPVIYKNNKINLTVSVGISIFPESGENTDDLILNADIAMYNAKKNDGFSYVFYEKGMEIK